MGPAKTGLLFALRCDDCYDWNNLEYGIVTRSRESLNQFLAPTDYNM